jgi:phosphate transport system permease protein
MTTTAASPQPMLRARAGTGVRRFRSGVATALIALSFVVALVPLVFVVVYIAQQGMKVMSWSFLTGDVAFSARSAEGGIGPAIVGTVIITLGAALLAVPLGVLGGVYLNEYGARSKFAALVRFLAEILTGVPSIVMGLFIYTLWVVPRQGAGYSAFAGSLALACLMLPVIIRTSEEMLKLVPSELREGSLALGCRKSRTIRTVVLPHAAPGIVSGALLAVARAAGETAPLLFVIGATTSVNKSWFHGANTALSVQIFGNANSPFVDAQQRAYGAALTLIVIVFIATALARIVTVIYTRRTSGAA